MTSNSPNFLLPVPATSLQIPPQAILANCEQNLRFSLVLPTYNEAKNIPEIILKLTEILDREIPGEYELIVIDDNSPDRTWEIAQNLISKYPQLRVMRRETERGLSTAVIRGWQVAKGDVLGVIDADLQHPPETLLKLWGGNTTRR